MCIHRYTKQQISLSLYIYIYVIYIYIYICIFIRAYPLGFMFNFLFAQGGGSPWGLCKGRKVWTTAVHGSGVDGTQKPIRRMCQVFRNTWLTSQIPEDLDLWGPSALACQVALRFVGAHVPSIPEYLAHSLR